MLQHEVIMSAVDHNWFKDVWAHPEVLLTGSAQALVLSAAVRALPTPEPMGNKLYQWFYVFAQSLLANPDKATTATKAANGKKP